jgi:hypothetical protein
MPFTLKIPNIKIPQIARWRIAGVSDKMIAQEIHMTVSGLAQLLATPEYRDYEAALMNGHLTAMDAALKGKINLIHNELRGAVPAAVRCLIDLATQRKDMKAAFAASKEILDRDPDRTLPASTSEEAVAPGVPAAVLEAAAEEGNKIASTYTDKAKIN